MFLALAAAAAAGLFTNPYAGLVIFIALPAIFVVGLLLIPFGLWLTATPAASRPDGRGRRVAGHRLQDQVGCAARPLSITALTAANVAILLVAGYGTLHWMESPKFCGQTCHTPMHPQFTAWQQTTHSRWTASPATSAKAGRRSCNTSWPAPGS